MASMESCKAETVSQSTTFFLLKTWVQLHLALSYSSLTCLEHQQHLEDFVVFVSRSEATIHCSSLEDLLYLNEA